MKKDRINIEELEKAVRAEFDIVTWTSAKIEGTKLLIRIRENDLITVEESGMDFSDAGQGGMDLVAEKSGEVVSIVTRSGVPVVKAGTQVEKGDILVEGCVPIMNEDGSIRRYEYCHADADILLRCVYSMNEELPEKYEQKAYTGKEKKIPFVMFGTRKMKIPVLGKSTGQCDIVEEKTQLRLFQNYYLPIYIGRDYIREYLTEEKIYTREEIKTLFEGKIQKFIESLDEKGVQIIEKNVTIDKTSGVWKMKVDFLAVEETGTAQKSQRTNPQEITDRPADEEEEKYKGCQASCETSLC